MGRKTVIKWERPGLCKPVHNIISSDFPKYTPVQWKFLEGPADMSLILAHEYQRLWIHERDQWYRHMNPENPEVTLDVIKRYVMSFKNAVKPPKPDPKAPFIMKKFQGIEGKTKTRRAKKGGNKAPEVDVKQTL